MFEHIFLYASFIEPLDNNQVFNPIPVVRTQTKVMKMPSNDLTIPLKERSSLVPLVHCSI